MDSANSDQRQENSNILVRNNWTIEEIQQILSMPFMQLLDKAHTIHKNCFDPNLIQISTLLNIKTGGCPENCSYCPQSAHYETGLQREKLMSVEQVVKAAKAAKQAGASRFCIGAAWRGPNEKDLSQVCEMVKKVKKLGLETCATLGLLDQEQAEELEAAGLDFYNHNIDTSKEHYDKIITTRNFQDRIDTLQHVRNAGLKVCCGGILGMGETPKDRASMLQTLSNFNPHPESVPINMLIQIPGTPLENQKQINSIDFVRTIATARVVMPYSYLRLSAGREHMTDECQALCYYAGANSIFFGEKLLTAKNPLPEKDLTLFEQLGLNSEQN